MTRALGSRPEARLGRVVAGWLEAQGYRVVVNPDATDYFDLVAIRTGEVGLVELKASADRRVRAQAWERRAWARWLAVATSSPRAAAAIARPRGAGPADRLGVWLVRDGTVTVVRAPTPLVRPGEADPFRALRERFARRIDEWLRTPSARAVRWTGLGRSIRRASHGRRFSEWRLEEFDERPASEPAVRPSGSSRD